MPKNQTENGFSPPVIIIPERMRDREPVDILIYNPNCQPVIHLLYVFGGIIFCLFSKINLNMVEP